MPNEESEERVQGALAAQRRQLEMAQKVGLIPPKPISLYADSFRRAFEQVALANQSLNLIKQAALPNPTLFSAPKVLESLIGPAKMAERIRAQSLGIVNQSIASQLGAAFNAVNLAQRMSEQLNEPLRRLREIFEGYEEDEARFLGELVPRGWLISPSMSIFVIRRLARALGDHSVEEVEDALIEYFDTDRCSEIVSGFFGVPAFARRRQLLEDALEAHAGGKHTLSIPVWLLCIDGIAHEEWEVPRIFASVQRRDGGYVRVAVESEHPSDTLLEALIDVLQQSGVSARPDDLRQVPNRNLILHGLDPEYASAKTSIQLVLVLEVMHYLLKSDSIDAESGKAVSRQTS